MQTLTHRELRNGSSDVLRRVAAGESFVVTNHGQVAALLVPPQRSMMDVLDEAGDVRPARGRPGFAGLKRATGLNASDVLADLRGDR